MISSSQIQQLEAQVIDSEKRAFTAHQQVRVPTHIYSAELSVCV